MRVALDSRFLLPHLEGFGRFTLEVASRLVRMHPETDFDLLFDRKPLDKYRFGPNQHNAVIPPQTRHWLLYELWWHYALPFYLRKRRPQVFFSTYGQLSPAVARQVPVVAFVHDIAFIRYPEFLPKGWYAYYTRTIRHTIRGASLLIANSESVRSDLVTLLETDADKIRVAYNGCDTEFFRPIPPEQYPHVREKYTGGLPYLLYVGSIHPRKNPVRLLQAYDLLRGSYTEPLRLLLVGRFMFDKGPVDTAYRQMRHKEEVIFHPPVPDSELVKLYGAASVVVYPSLYEGFGYPVAEGLACGVPVVTSQCSSLPEVGGTAAFYANPHDPADIARAIQEALIQSPQERSRRAEEGRRHVKQFSWERCVQTIWEALSEVAR